MFITKYNLLVTAFVRQILCPGGGIGRHKGFKIPRRQLRAGSSPALGTILNSYFIYVSRDIYESCY